MLQDFAAYRKQYLDAHIDYRYRFETSTGLSNIVFDNDQLCSVLLNEAYQLKLNFMGKFHDLISRYPIPPIAALVSRLADIGVRTTFVVIASTAILLLEELEDRVEEFAEKLRTDPWNEHQVSNNLDEWKCQYDLVVSFIEQINRCFGLILLLISSIDFIVSVTEFQNIQKYNFSNPRTYFNCIHSLLRALVVIMISNCVKSKVQIVILLKS